MVELTMRRGADTRADPAPRRRIRALIWKVSVIWPGRQVREFGKLVTSQSSIAEALDTTSRRV